MIENTGGQLVGVEVKASATVKERNLSGLKKLASLAGDQFTAGVLLYDGDERMPLGRNIWAAPFPHGGVRRTIGYMPAVASQRQTLPMSSGHSHSIVNQLAK